MNISQNKLQEVLTLYLNDIEDYGTPDELVLAESALSPFKQLLTESKKPTKQLIEEIFSTSEPKSQIVITDFLKYFNQIK
jgi:hypothetical protein